jgi:hypothetical protein
MTQPMRTVLIFAHECAPYHAPASTIGAQRVAQFAKHLPSFGWRAIVICCDLRERATGWSEAAERRIEALVRDAPRSESLIIPTPSLPWHGAVDRWWRASLPGPDTPSYLAIWRRPLTAIKQLTRGDYSSAWQPCARRVAEMVLRVEKVDACIGEHTPDAGVLLANWFSRRAAVPWVADFRDPVLRPFPVALRALYLPRIRGLLSTAASTINVNEHLAELDRQLLRRPALNIPNGFDPEEFAGHLPADRNETFTVAYCGNINPQIQRLEIFFEALQLIGEQLTPQELEKFRFVYRGNGAEFVRELARDMHVAALVDCQSHVPRTAALSILRSADALLLLSVTDPIKREPYFSQGLYPGKTFEYFGAGRPILCVPGDGGMLDELIRETRTGVILETPTGAAQHLVHAYRKWQGGHRLPYEPNMELIAQFTRRALTGRLAALLDGLAPNIATSAASA